MVTDTQLCLTIGIPTLIVILTSYLTHCRFKMMCDKIDRFCNALCVDMKAFEDEGHRDWTAFEVETSRVWPVE